MTARLLLFTHDDALAAVVALGINQRGWQLEITSSPADALAAADENPFDLVLVDDGEQTEKKILFCSDLRQMFVNPLLFLTENPRESYQLKLYQTGIDDVLIKPIGLSLLMAKIGRWLQRAWTVPALSLDPVEVGSFKLDTARRTFYLDASRHVKLTNLEFRLLHLLLNNPARILETEHIINRVWGFHGEGDQTLLKHVVYRLRRKIEPNPSSPCHLITVAGEGVGFYP